MGQTRFGAERADRTFLESTADIRSPLHTWAVNGADWLERMQISTEMQWPCHGSSGDQVETEVALGLRTISTPFMRLAPVLSVTVAGPQQGVIRLGIGVGVH